MKYRKKPVVIEAMQWDGTAADAQRIACWTHTLGMFNGSADNPQLTISTLEGVMLAKAGDFIIKGVAGEFYPIKEAIFRETYEPVTSGPSVMDQLPSLGLIRR